MKPVFKLAAIIVILVACAEASVFAASQPKVAARKEVKVYFYHDPGEFIDLAPVTRSVNAIAPARPAIEALLKGPTPAERRKGFGPLVGVSEARVAARVAQGSHISAGSNLR